MQFYAKFNYSTSTLTLKVKLANLLLFRDTTHAVNKAQNYKYSTDNKSEKVNKLMYICICSSPNTPTSAPIYLSPSNLSPFPLSPFPFSPSSTGNSDSYPSYASTDLCQSCKSPLTAPYYCQKCTAECFKNQFSKWTSGDAEIDAIIQESQVTATNREELIEWISFDRFGEVTYVAQGGFGKVYSAVWIDGPIVYWDKERGEWLRRQQYKVALKVLKNEENGFVGSFLHEFQAQRNANKSSHDSYVIWFMGITKDPSTQTYILVMPFAQYGDLRTFIRSNYATFTWTQRLKIVYYISEGLSNIHDAGIIHKDFHTGNILQLSTHHSYIGDFGLSEPADAPYFMLVEGERAKEGQEQLNQLPSSSNVIDFVHPKACYSSRLLSTLEFSSKNEDEDQDFTIESRENDNLINWNEKVSEQTNALDYTNSEHEQHSSSLSIRSSTSIFSSGNINSNNSTNLTQIGSLSLLEHYESSNNSVSSSKNNSNASSRKSSMDITLRRERGEVIRLEQIAESPVMENSVKSQAINASDQSTGITSEFTAFEIVNTSRNFSTQFRDPEDSEENFEQDSDNNQEDEDKSFFKDSFGSNDKLYTPILPPGVRESQHTGLTPDIQLVFGSRLFSETKETSDFTAGSLFDFELMSPPPSDMFSRDNSGGFTNLFGEYDDEESDCEEENREEDGGGGGIPSKAKERWRNFDISMEHFSSGRAKRSLVDSDGESNKVDEEVHPSSTESFVISSPVMDGIGRPDSRYE
ncbi:2135_t:CDS:2 [Ambispora gerdemannii]|uniref:2135_t:CDS:1 n=1 Tax=Ambispora gerdemannii TaxID=144530 RepID=A0A9N9GCL8_9GLOM|nr:2135_t:CDS:2 [Ambispora gerdemannii]